ncbi:hypothetical protein CANCADRAFT_84995 [Tortispora caseinolytica NRRL Y-17796]|uniref:Pyruvate decarboxylase n=1 Tax=Tortispora caseinolytica NRRL Y-17796 TaxID=767744 RepID=A0A1E4TKP5_9ASCO|nr:hypothetical protein CANCADRAFT_84995 [Tortispora caseinolytica NRRL Y-17796]
MRLECLIVSLISVSTALFESLGRPLTEIPLGSDHPSIIETFTNDPVPLEIVTCPNEMVALSAAQAMAQVTGRAQAVIVHVDVGTAALGGALHNVSCSRVPVLIFAGLSPLTQEGELPGSRTEYIHYLQDVHNQRNLVNNYTRFDYEIRSAKHIKQMVNRALMFANSEPKGPVYLCAAREVLEEQIEPYKLNQNQWLPVELGVLPHKAVHHIVQLLSNATRPLIVTGSIGRDISAVKELEKLAMLLDIEVLDTGLSDLNFPANCHLWRGSALGSSPLIPEADVILILNCNVPFIPTQSRPADTATVVHIDVDVLKENMPLHYTWAEYKYRADAAAAVCQLLEYCEANGTRRVPTQANVQRYQQFVAELTAKEQVLSMDAPLTAPVAIACVREQIPMNSMVLSESVTNAINVVHHMRLTEPGSFMNSGGGGLGWLAGGAVGAKLGLQSIGQTDRFLTAFVGDGCFVFSVPTAAYWMAARYNTPFLTIVFNNGGWNAPKHSTLLVHPHGSTSKSTRAQMHISFENPDIDYGAVAKAASGGSAYVAEASTMSQLLEVLPQAIAAVKKGNLAVIDLKIVKIP